MSNLKQSANIQHWYSAGALRISQDVIQLRSWSWNPVPEVFRVRCWVAFSACFFLSKGGTCFVSTWSLDHGYRAGLSSGGSSCVKSSARALGFWCRCLSRVSFRPFFFFFLIWKKMQPTADNSVGRSTNSDVVLQDESFLLQGIKSVSGMCCWRLEWYDIESLHFD